MKNHWDKSFSREEYIYGKDPNVFLEEMSHIFPSGSRIACLAEGEGRNAVFLAQAGHDVTAYDHSQVALDKTRKLAESKGVSLEGQLIDLTKEKLPEGEFDAGTLIFGHVPRESQEFLFDNLFQTVRSGGYVLFEVYSEKQIDYKTGGPGVVTSLYRAEDLLAFSEEHEILHFYYGEAERFEGINHTGRCHLIQALIRIK